MKEEFPREWYWLAALILFFLEREVVLDLCFALIHLVFLFFQ